MVLDHFADLEADFQRFYQIDLPAAMWGPTPMSARRFRSLVERLPAGSSLSGGWGTVEELLALMVEHENAVWRVLVQVNSEEGTIVPDQLRIPRPYDDTAADEPRPQSTPAEISAFLGIPYTAEVD